jgi:hypothetical protein
MRLCIALLLASSALAQRPDPEIQKIVSEISKDRIADTLKALTGFGTRGNFTDPNQQGRGVGAARRWIFDQLKSYSPRLEVAFDPYKVKKQGTRIMRDFEAVNVVAVLPGTTNPEQRIIVSGHYDSLDVVRKTNVPATRPDGSETPVDEMNDFEASINAPAPGGSDDASGTAVVLELARVMSQYKFEKTIVFITFQAEEMGLIGSSLYADKAKERGDKIEAVLNNDIVGIDLAGNGHAANGYVHIFSEDPDDSGSRELARYIRSTAELYVPSFKAELVFRSDRFGRGGDHTPFNQDGFTAVRFTTPAENLGIQHTAEDTLDKTSPDYTANVARVNGAAIANLALAPNAPQTMRELTTGINKGRLSPNLGRGKGHYDAVLNWKDAKPAADLAGYIIQIRSTTQSYWDHEIFAGKVTTYTIPDFSIDDVVLGVQAVDNDGHRSLVSPYLSITYPRRPIETQP